jgi:hypothetical protein
LINVLKEGNKMDERWNDIEKVGYPKEDKPYIVFHKNIGVTILCWNCHYKVWDTSDCDDFYCEKEEVTHWVELPEKPK